MLQSLPKVYFQSDAVTIQYDEEQRLGMAIWRGHFNSADLREAILLCGYIIERFGLTRWLADNRRMRAFSDEDKLWMLEHMVPKLMTSALCRMATLVSADEKQAAAIKYIEKHAGDLGKLLIRDFQDEEEALEWLLQETDPGPNQ
ncbi:STAS/SEC14 domain-containing protein [Rufibacter ruber]|uniref:STAS/SEC14 domain-containing protein n=1 Tax=Rufibacter ruber TaxID=1783499 RepID=UPI000832703C|nr:STAS/SEC14 domain-containing protein [Rufibacter ruber]